MYKRQINRKAGKFEPEQFKDEFTDAVWELIHAKIEHRAPEIVTEGAPTAKVINIMDALKKSVQQGKGGAAAKAPRKTSAKKKTAAASKRGAKKTAAPKRKSA